MALLWHEWQPLPLVQHAPTVHRCAPPPTPLLGQHPHCPNDGAIVESSDNTCGGCCHSSGITTTPEVNTSSVVAPLPSLGKYHCPNNGAVLLSTVTAPVGAVTMVVTQPHRKYQLPVQLWHHYRHWGSATPEVLTSSVVVAPPVTTAQLGPASNQAQSSS
ncbi:hypothetical protein K439DRAFT_1625337 [Ramaria rubella]|nr:hypothetical protein K439DRAFT_1625337 [Ramaria rubella]